MLAVFAPSFLESKNHDVVSRFFACTTLRIRPGEVVDRFLQKMC